MVSSHPHDAPEARKANRLYWESDQSVNAVAELLGVSKGRLYDLVSPLPIDIPCPECGRALAFPNRTARDRGLVTCDTCGFEGDRDDLEGVEADSAGNYDEGSPRGDYPFSGRPSEGDEGLLRVPLLGNPVVLGGLFVGVVGGVLLARWMRD